MMHNQAACADADEERRACRSQPAPAPVPVPAAPAAAEAVAGELSAADMDALISYSQPTRAEDLLLASTQDATQLTQPVSDITFVSFILPFY